VADHELRCPFCTTPLVDGRCPRCATAPRGPGPTGVTATREQASVDSSLIARVDGERDRLGVFTPTGSTGLFAKVATLLATAFGAVVGVVVAVVLLGVVGGALAGVVHFASGRWWLSVLLALVGLVAAIGLVVEGAGLVTLVRTRHQRPGWADAPPG